MAGPGFLGGSGGGGGGAPRNLMTSRAQQRAVNTSNPDSRVEGGRIPVVRGKDSAPSRKPFRLAGSTEGDQDLDEVADID